MKKILLADDQKIIHYGIKEIINQHKGLNIADSAYSEEETFEKIDSKDYDLLITDISMLSDTYKFISDIKNRKPDMPIIVYSIYPEEHRAVKLIEMGISGYLFRTAEEKEIINAIEKVLSGGIYISPDLAEYYAKFMKLGSNKPKHHYLTQREYSIFVMLASGMSLDSIAKKLLLSKNTIANHRYHILQKINAGNNVQLTLYAIKHDLIDPKQMFEDS